MFEIQLDPRPRPFGRKLAKENVIEKPVVAPRSPLPTGHRPGKPLYTVLYTVDLSRVDLSESEIAEHERTRSARNYFL